MAVLLTDVLCIKTLTRAWEGGCKKSVPTIARGPHSIRQSVGNLNGDAEMLYLEEYSGVLLFSITQDSKSNLSESDFCQVISFIIGSYDVSSGSGGLWWSTI